MSETFIRLQDLLDCLLDCSEKAAKIARAFRAEEGLFGLLVEEKSGIEKNRTLIQDFKTLADVLVQETIKRDVGRNFPTLSSKIQGEEQNSFQNTLGESIKVELTDSLEETTNLLSKVLDDRASIAESLATIVHSDTTQMPSGFSSAVTIPAERLGIWIDPIDSTAEYIQGKQNKADEHGIALYGLKCVNVLIGVYDLVKGVPIMGIINQPFYKECKDTLGWESNIYWGISYNTEFVTSTSLENKTQERQKIIVTSSFESKQLQTILQSRYAVIHAAGAGYKCLVVAKQTADLYVLSLQNTHFWDTCGPHAILSAQGGGIVSFSKVVNSEEIVDHSSIQNYQLKYLGDMENTTFKNVDGIIAYRNPDDLLELLQILKENGYTSL